MAGFTDYLEHKLLDHIFTDVAWTPPTPLYIGLFTTNPSDDIGTGLVEATGGSYARAAVAAAQMNSATGSSKENGLSIDFATATALWGTIVGFGLFDAISGGNLLGWAAVAVPKVVDNGDTAKFPSGSFAIAMD